MRQSKVYNICYTRGMDPLAEEKRKELELNILKVIEEKISSGEMDEKRVHAIAVMVLDKLHPPLSLEQIYKIAPTLDDEFKELTKAVLPLMQEHDDLIRKEVSKHATALIKSGKFDQADTILKEAMKSNM